MEIVFLKAFQHIEVVTLYIKVLCGVEVHALLRAGAQRGADGRVGSKYRLALVGPSELIALFVAFYNIGRQQLAQLVKINGTFYPPILLLTSVIHSGNNSAIRLILSCTPSAVCIFSLSIFLKYFVVLIYSVSLSISPTFGVFQTVSSVAFLLVFVVREF